MSDLRSRKNAPRNIALWDLARYRLPWAGKASILHRISGALLFLALPALLWALERSLTVAPAGASASSWHASLLVRLAALLLAWAYLHHFLAGLRYLVLDFHVGLDKRSATLSAKGVSFGALALTAALGARLFGLF